MNLAQLTEAVRVRCGIGTTDPKYPTIPGRINEALRALEIGNPRGWDWLKTDIVVTLPAEAEGITWATLNGSLTGSSVRKIRAVEARVDADGDWTEPLPRGQRDQLRERSVRPATDVLPVAWASEARTLWLFPTLTSDCQLRVGLVVTEPELTAEGDMPRLPDEYHQVLIAAASALVLRSLQRGDEAKLEADAASAGRLLMLGDQRPFTGAGAARGREW